jgi:hypothetical protein
MQVNTNLYEFSHSHAPRGYGIWFFDIKTWNRGTLLEKVSGNGPYSDIKKLAIKRAREIGANYLEVCS